MKKFLVISALAICSITAFAQNRETAEIYFKQNISVIDGNYKDNANTLKVLENRLRELSTDSLTTIDSIIIDSYTSPEGGLTINSNLSQRRADAICDFISSKNLNIDASLYKINSNGIAWDELKRLVENSNIEYKNEIIRIINEVPEETWAKTAQSRWLKLVDSRNKQLMDLNYGKPYRYMLENIFPQLRKSSVVTIYYVQEIPVEPAINDRQNTEAQNTNNQDTTAIEKAVEPTIEPAPEYIEKPLFAIKTNLLYDLATALNVEVEVPLGDRFSIAGEWMFPWWTSCGNSSNAWQSDSKRNTFEMLNANLELKYWFGDRTARPVMTGWFAGLYGGWGKYDLERKAKGYQGDFYVGAISGGYAHTINKSGSLRLEYSLGLGYMQTNYDKYEEHFGIDDKWHTVRQETGKQSWLGPTKLKVSLVWMLNSKILKK